MRFVLVKKNCIFNRGFVGENQDMWIKRCDFLIKRARFLTKNHCEVMVNGVE